MDTIDKWLKSLRLHKYTHLFKSLTYEQMLNLEEKYLIERDVTKGARNKMLVSVKKLNLRQERLLSMIDDLNQDNISMKEALTVLKDMLITPIPPPDSTNIRIHHYLQQQRQQLLQQQLHQQTSLLTKTNYSDPYELTYLFIETLEKVAQRLIESAGMEDNACHGIMAAIVDECLKHNSFTKEQKGRVASFKQHFTKEQKAKAAGFKQQLRQRPHSYNHHHYQQLKQQQHQQHQFHHNHHYHCYHNHWSGPIQQPPSLSASLSTIGSASSTIGSASTSDEEERQTYKEYSLLGPGMTFELPCLRALAASEKHNRRQLCFLSVFQSKGSC